MFILHRCMTATAFVGILLLAGCASPDNPAPSEPVPAAEAAVMPTVANLEGVWDDTVTFRSGNTTTEKRDRRVTFGPGNLWSQHATSETTPDTGSVTKDYTEADGTFALAGDVLTLTSTRHRGSLTPFSDTTTGWIDETANPTTSQYTAILYQSKLYANPKCPVYKIDGVRSGLVGNWAAILSSSQTSWYKYVYEFQSTGDVAYSGYSSGTSTFGNASGTTNMTYSLPSAGQITFGNNGVFVTQPYLQVGDYFLTATEPTLGAATKE